MSVDTVNDICTRLVREIRDQLATCYPEELIANSRMASQFRMTEKDTIILQLLVTVIEARCEAYFEKMLDVVAETIIDSVSKAVQKINKEEEE